MGGTNQGTSRAADPGQSDPFSYPMQQIGRDEAEELALCLFGMPV